MFKHEGTLDRLLIVGRWQSTRTARTYLNEGLSVLAELRLPWSKFALTVKTQYLSSLHHPLQNLDPGTSKKRQTRGTWKKKTRAKHGKGGVTFCDAYFFSASRLPWVWPGSVNATQENS